MPTPKNAPYKKQQRACKEKLRRVFLLWGRGTRNTGTYIRKIHGEIGIRS